MVKSKGMVEAGDVKVSIKPFDGKDDFTLWQRKMKNVLIQQETDEAIGTKPTSMSDAEWTKKNKKAKSCIELHLADNVLLHIGETMTAKEAWEKLESVYRGKSIGNKLLLKEQLFGLRMEEGDDLNDHICKFQNCIANLEKVGAKMDDEDTAVMLLHSLPPSFKHFKTTMIFKESITLSKVCENLESYIRLEREEDSSQARGLYVRGKERGRSRNRGGGFQGRARSKSKGKGKEKKDGCFICGSPDHWKRNCKQWKEKKAQMSGESSQSANVVIGYNDEDGELLAISTSSGAPRHWTLDTACTFHMCAHRDWFNTYKERNTGSVLMGNDSPSRIMGIGTVRIRMHDGIVRTLGNVRHIPGLSRNLISLSTMDRAGFWHKGQNGVLKVGKGQMVYMKGAIQPDNMYKLTGSTVEGGAAVCTEEDKTELWHRRLGHMSQRGLQELHKKEQLDGVMSAALEFCKYCTLGKQTRVSFNLSSSENKSKGVLDYIHTDVWGPSATISKGGARYFVSFIDDFSRKVWIFFMKTKNEVFTKFKEWKAEVENQTGRKIKCLRSDNGGEYRDKKFLQLCKDEGITRHFTVKKTPQQNGVAERMNRTLMEKERSMRFHAGLPEEFWAEAANHACYLINRSPSRAINFKCAEEVWSGKPVDYSNLRVFGCSAYAHIPKDERTKLEPKSLECLFIGFEKGVKGYKLWDIVNEKKVISRDVVFDEKTMPLNEEANSKKGQMAVDEGEAISISLAKPSVADSEAQVEQIEQGNDEVAIEEPEHQQQPTVMAQVEQSPQRGQNSPIPQAPESFKRSIALDKPKRNRKPIQRFGFEPEEDVSRALSISQGDPTTYEDAIESVESAGWIGAMTEEMESLHKNSVWELVPKPKERKLVGCKWVFRKKEGIHDDDAITYKARLVAKGYSQKGVDYDEIFSPVVKHTSIRLLLSIAAQYDMEIEQMDVKTAFLHGDLEEDIYMSQPEGFVETGKENLVCRLRKSLYGLKQSPRQWYKRFDTYMLKIGYTRCLYDCCVYYHVFEDGEFILLLLYVDDMLIACREMSKIQELKKKLGAEFDMKDLGAAQKILGIEIKRDRSEGKIWLSQEKYIMKVLERFNMDGAKFVSTPLAAHFKLSAQQRPSNQKEIDAMKNVPYASAVGCLMYAMICTRPDLAQALSVVSKYMSNPGKRHWEAVKWILRYLKRTKQLGIMFERKQGEACVAGFVDSDFAGDLDKRRSTTGYVFTCGGGPVSWKATLQAVTALSTTEAEYMALTEASKEAIWLNGLASQFGIHQEGVVVKCDSQSAIHLAKNQVFHARTKHIDVRYHRIRDWVEAGDIIVEKVHTNDNAADCLTKPVSAEKFKHCLDLLSVTAC